MIEREEREGGWREKRTNRKRVGGREERWREKDIDRQMKRKREKGGGGGEWGKEGTERKREIKRGYESKMGG